LKLSSYFYPSILQAFIMCHLDWCNSLLYRCGRTYSGRCSLYRTLPLIYLAAHGTVTTSLRCCINYIGCRSRESGVQVLYTSCWPQQHWRT